MRVVAVMLAFVSMGGTSLATADPSTSQSSAPAASAPAPVQRSASDSTSTGVQTPATANGNPTSAQSAAPTSTADAAPAIDMEEKHLLSEGYKIQMRHGDKYFCRREEVLGSRLGGQLACATQQQLEATEDQAKRMTENAQHQQSQGPSSK